MILTKKDWTYGNCYDRFIYYIDFICLDSETIKPKQKMVTPNHELANAVTAFSISNVLAGCIACRFIPNHGLAVRNAKDSIIEEIGTHPTYPSPSGIGAPCLNFQTHLKQYQQQEPRSSLRQQAKAMPIAKHPLRLPFPILFVFLSLLSLNLFSLPIERMSRMLGRSEGLQVLSQGPFRSLFVSSWSGLAR